MFAILFYYFNYACSPNDVVQMFCTSSDNQDFSNERSRS